MGPRRAPGWTRRSQASVVRAACRSRAATRIDAAAILAEGRKRDLVFCYLNILKDGTDAAGHALGDVAGKDSIVEAVRPYPAWTATQAMLMRRPLRGE
jgi:hypothetical protein